MAKHQLSFFATEADLVLLLETIESKRGLQFVSAGLFDSPIIAPMESLLAVREFGRTASGSASQSVCFIVANRDCTIEVRPVPQRRGGVRYAVDQLANPRTIVFRPGGKFSDTCLIAGEVGTASENPQALEIFRVFSRETRRQFTKIKSFYVGREAGELLDMGWRLTTDVKAPALYDLKRD